MKLKYFTSSILAAGLLSVTGCVNDLDVFPLDPNVQTSNVAYDSAESYTQALNKIYSVWALAGQDGANSSDISGLDAGETVLLRCWYTLQETTSDECKIAWPDAYIAGLNQMTWGTTITAPVEGAYQRGMYVVALVNEFLNNIGNAPAGIDQAQYSAEARFCRALAYYVLMDLYGRPPFITESNYSLAPSQLERADLFGWIEGELLGIYDALPTQPEYGRAGKAAVDALLSRMYLNAEVYTGTPRYDDCIARCNNIFGMSNYSLADSYAELFMADNGENARTNKEIIFPIVNDGISTQSYGIGAVVRGSRAQAESSIETYGCSPGWDGFRSTGNLVRLFDFGSTDESEWTADNIVDKRGIFYNNGRTIDITTSSQSTFTKEGWAVYKWTNLNSDGTPGKNADFPDTDFPLFRLGEIYLNYAEAVARGGQGGSMTTAVQYINDLRRRGYGDNSHDIDQNWLTANANIGGTSANVRYGNLLNERGREMYFEAVRRTDLIRFGLFTSGSYLWADKGGIITGVGVEEYRNLFPISVNDMSVNANLTQNDGYK